MLGWPLFLVSTKCTRAAQCRRSRPAMRTSSRSTQQERVSSLAANSEGRHALRWLGRGAERKNWPYYQRVITHLSIYYRLSSSRDLLTLFKPTDSHTFYVVCFFQITFTSAFSLELIIPTPSSSNMPDSGDLRKLSSDKPSCFFPCHGTWIPGISIIYKRFKMVPDTQRFSLHVFASDVECECLFVCLTVCVCASPWVVMRCSAAMDILFLMDGSYSVGKGSFERSKHYAIKLCQALDIGPDKVSMPLGLHLSVFRSFFFL